jgi:hypothetical protein
MMGITPRFSTQKSRQRRVARHRKLFMEQLEDRRLLAVDLVSVADPALVPDSASGDVGYDGRKISDDGRLLVFTSDAVSRVSF